MGELFLRLFNMSITASCLILAVLCVRLLFRKIPKWANCLLWGVVAVRLIFPFSIESVFSLQPSAQPFQAGTVVEGEVLPYVPSVDSNLPVVENTINPILAETFAYQESEGTAPLQVISEVAGLVWLLGMIVLLMSAVVGTIRLQLLVKESVCCKDRVYICDAVKSPFILGIIRPRIYLSSALNGEEARYVLAHEMAHLKRKDHFWKPFGYLLLSVYWFNPLCWVAYRMLCKDIELACDEKVIRDMNFADKKEYSKVLLSCATQRRLVMACPLAFGEVGVKERVKTVLYYKKPAFWITISAVVVCAVIAICFLTNPPKEYRIKITIPAGSTQGFCYSKEEISPKGNTLSLYAGEGLGDCEVVLDIVEAWEENAYNEPVYITSGMPVKMDVEKGAWFRIGVNMQNPTEEAVDVYVRVKNVEVRISSKVQDQALDPATGISEPLKSSPESDNHSVVTEPPLNDSSVTIGGVSLSLSESKQDILAKLEAAGFDYSVVQPDFPGEAKYDLYYNVAGCLQIYFLDNTCVRIRLINLDSASDRNAQTARGLHPGDTYSQMTDLYGDDYETHTYSYKGLYTIYRYSLGDCICEFGIEGENRNSFYNIDIYLPGQLPIYEYGEEILPEAADYQSIGDEVYRKLILEMMETNVFPATEGVQCNGMPYDNSFSLMDIDNDGKEELLINYANARCTADMVLYIYDYDRETKEIYIECAVWPAISVYDNGYIKGEASHNHGRSNLDGFWPYCLLKYDASTDRYEAIANIDAWQYQISELSDPDPEFPKEKDLDGDGIVYYDMYGDYYKPTQIMDKAEYDEWCRQYTQGNIRRITWIPIISEEKYNEMFPSKAVG